MTQPKGTTVDKDYAYASAGISGIPTQGAALPKPSVDIIIRNLTSVLHTLAAEVSGMSDRIHGASALGGINVPGPTNEAPAWADDQRLSAGRAIDRGEMALKELSRIRETLGL